MDKTEYMREYMRQYREKYGCYTEVQKKCIKKYRQTHKDILNEKARIKRQMKKNQLTEPPQELPLSV